MAALTSTILASVALAMAAGGSAIQLHQANDAKQEAKGAANAQQDAITQQVRDAKAKDTADQNTASTSAGSTQGAALAALRASLSATNGMGGTILSGATGAAPAPTSTKQLLGA